MPAAAVSVGVVDAACLLDLDYSEDARAEVDMNVVMTGSGRFIEVQGTAEGMPFSRGELEEMLALAERGIAELVDGPERRAGGTATAAMSAESHNGSSALWLVLATANPDKASEIVAVVRDVAGDRIVLVDRPSDVPEVDETGDTLEENAFLKAFAVGEATGMPAIADDTGLEVHALDGAPGVRSSRYSGEHASYADNVAKLLSELERVGARHAGRAKGPLRHGRPRRLPRWQESRRGRSHRGHHLGRGDWNRGVRLRPGVRSRRRRRANVRADGACREARDLAPGQGIPGPRRRARHAGRALLGAQLVST